MSLGCFGTGPTCEDTAVPRPRSVTKGLRPVALLLTAWDIWRRLPPTQRRMIMDQARKHGPRLAGAAAAKGRERARRRRPKP
jgi:hypothetical protein